MIVGRCSARRRIAERVFALICLFATMVGILLLGVLLIEIWRQGSHWLSTDFLTRSASRIAGRSGIKPALYGSAWIMGLTALISLPVGIAAAIYLEEYPKRGRMSTFIEVNIANLAGVPSIVYGILGSAIFVHALALGESVLAGAFTMSLLILPTVIIAAREALRAVPNSLRLGAQALGATRWQTIRHHVLPAATPGILTGVILSLSRAIGETAPLIMVGAIGYVAFVPRGPGDQFTVLPIQIYNWASQPRAEFHGLAAAAIITLLAALLTMNAAAIVIRQRFQRYRG